MIEFCAITNNDGAFGILIFAYQVNTGSVAQCHAETFRFPQEYFQVLTCSNSRSKKRFSRFL